MSKAIKDEDIKIISSTFDSYHAGELVPVKGFSAIADIEDIAKQNYILTPGRFVGIEDSEADNVPFDKKMKELSSELRQLFIESDKLKEEILKNLKDMNL